MRARYLLFLFAIVFSFYNVEAQVDVQLISAAMSAAPGDVVTLSFEIRNLSAANDTFNFSVLTSQGLSILAPPAPLNLSAGSSETVFLVVFVGSDAPAGEGTVTLEVTSTNTGAISRTTASITINPRSSLQVSPAPGVTVERGETVVLTFQVTNTGNVIENLNLLVEASDVLSVTLLQSTLMLLPGETGPVEVEITIPSNANPGPFRITLVVASTLNNQITASANTVISVLPPFPAEISSNLFAELPADFSLNVSQEEDLDFPVISWDLNANGDLNPFGFVDLRISDLLGQTGLETFQFTIERNNMVVFIGDLLSDATTLVSTDGRGITFGTLDPVTGVQNFLIGTAFQDGNDFPQRSVLQLGVSPCLLSAGFGHNLDNGNTLGSIKGECLMGERLSTFAEGAHSFSSVSALSDTAARFNAFLDLTELQVSFDWLQAGTHFPGTANDRKEFTFGIESNFDIFDISLLYRIANDNVNEQAANTTFEKTVNGVLQFDLGEAFPMLTFSTFIFNEQTRSATMVAETRNIFTQTINVQQTVGSTVFSGFTALRLDDDRLSDQNLQTLQFGTNVTLDLSGIIALLGLDYTSVVDLGNANALVDQTTQISASIFHSNFGASINLLRSEDETQIFSNMDFQFGDISFNSGYEHSFGTVASPVKFNIGFGIEFDLPLPFLITKGQVEGIIFIDDNGNGRQDDGEVGVDNLILRVADERVRSNTSLRGFYRFPPLPSGMYLIDIENLPLSLASALPLPLMVTLTAGQLVNFDIPLVRVGAISGTVFDDTNENEIRDPEEVGIPAVRVRLFGPNNMTLETRTASDGSYQFRSLRPGTYIVQLDPITLPEDFESTTDAAVTVELQMEEVLTIDFGATEREKEVVFTFGAPIADFTFSPEQPQVGQTVMFDASLSSDIDGTIERYQWDFDDDGVFDDEGLMVTHEFNQSGRFRVTLLITDNADNTNAVTKTIVISE